MSPYSKDKKSIREIDFHYYITHYMNLIWRWKWWILIIGPIVTCATAIYLLKFSYKRPELETKALIGFESISNMSEINQAVSMHGNSLAKILESRNFLYTIVHKTSYRLSVKDFSRYSIFDSVYISPDAPSGKYEFIKESHESNNYSITYTNKTKGYRDKVVQSGRLPELSRIELPGIHLKFSENFIKAPKEFQFSILQIRRAIENLYKSLQIQGPQRNQQYIEVAIRGRDYKYITDVVNIIADHFVERNRSMRKNRTKSMLSLLEKQYKKAKEAVTESEAKLRSYRSENPAIGLDNHTEQKMDQIIALQSDTLNLNSDISDASDIKAKLRNTEQDDRINAAQEALIFLQSRNNTTAPVLLEELAQLSNRRTSLKENYSSNHPLMDENRNAIRKTVDKSEALISEFITKKRKTLSEKKGKIIDLSKDLQNLPGRELELTKRMRRQQAANDVYTRILDQYNQAKVSQSVDVADVYIMDYAIPPIPPPPNLMKLLLISFLTGLAVTLVPPIGFDLISKTVRMESELQKILEFPVLESIPQIIPAKDKNRKKAGSNKSSIETNTDTNKEKG